MVTAIANDAFSNPLFRLGYGSQSPLEATEYPMTRMTGNYALLNSLYRDNWVVQNVVGIIPDDMTKEWITLTGALTPRQITELERVQRDTGLRDQINRGLRPGLESLLLPASPEYQHFSSSMAREMIRYRQPLEKYLPPAIIPLVEELRKREEEHHGQ